MAAGIINEGEFEMKIKVPFIKGGFRGMLIIMMKNPLDTPLNFVSRVAITCCRFVG